MSTDQALALFQSVSFTMWIKQNKETQFQRTELSQLYLMRTLSIVLCIFFVPQKATSDNNEHLSTLKLDKQHNGDLKQYSLCLT